MPDYEKQDKICPECGSIFKRLTEHLKKKHGYTWQEGELVP